MFWSMSNFIVNALVVILSSSCLGPRGALKTSLRLKSRDVGRTNADFPV